jgi:hypothetical protein
MQTKSLSLTIDPDRPELTLWDRRHNQRLLIAPGFALFCPIVDGTPVRPRLVDTVSRPEEVTFVFEAPPLVDFQVHVKRADDHLEFSSRFGVTADCELNRLELFPRRTALTFYDVVNFRNRHHTPNTWPELNLGGEGFETDTYSGDWQFVPHPSLFILRKGDFQMFFGALDLPTSFGMFLKVKENRVAHWYLDYGQEGFGQPLKSGETFTSPRFCLFVDHDKTVYETLDRYTALLVQEGLIPDPSDKARHAWHTEPSYATWIDQGYKVTLNPDVESFFQLDEEMAREALSVIRRERLPFRLFYLDDAWQVTRGQWEPDPQRLPDLRQLVDEIHAEGMKVIVWWNWAELYDDAEVDPTQLIGGGKRNRHGMRMRDYSHPVTQEYLDALFHKLFSPDPGCYDLDGIKSDYQADKVHPEMPVHDPEWRGEENYFFQVYKLFFGLMRRYKPDACHVGCAGHPFLAEFIDINRTYDVATSNPEEHLTRALMLRHTTPGCPVAFDFHNFLENMDAYFRTARDNGCAVQVGNILGMKQDCVAPWKAADEAFYEMLRRELAKATPS